MTRLRQFLLRIAALFRHSHLDRDLDDQMQAHLELAEHDGVRRGLSIDQARLEARRAFGGVEQVKEAHRQERSAHGLETFIRDVRYGCAALARDPGFSLVAIGILALGIGANAAMFSLVDAVLLKPMPFPHPEQVVRVSEAPTPTTVNQTTAFNFSEWKRLSSSFEALSVEVRTDTTAIIANVPARLSGKSVSADYFTVFGLPPLLGRIFDVDDGQRGATPVVVLSHAMWQSRLAGNPNVVGQDLILDGTPHRIVGIMPAGTFDRDDMARPGEDAAAFWKPLILTPTQLAAGDHWIDVVGRLRSGTTIEQARQEMLGVRAQIAPSFAAYKKDWSISVEPFDERLIGAALRRQLFVAFGAVALVLLIACANVANLLLGKSVARAKEMAVRAALGASRGRLIRQVLTETMVLCALGTAAGLALAGFLIGMAVPLLPHAIPSTAVVGLDGRVFAFASIAAVGVTLLVGLFPSLRSSSSALAPALNQAARGSSGGRERLRRAIVVSEVALSLVLICGALLLMKSLMNLRRVDLGVRIDNVLTMTTDLPTAGYETPEAAAVFFKTVADRIEAVPGVEFAAIADRGPLGGAGGENLRLPGGDDRILVRYKRVGAGYFRTLDVPVVAGREFTAADQAGTTPVAVINQTLADQVSQQFGVKNPVGQFVSLPALGYDGGATRVTMQIVGVVRGERVQRDLRTPLEPVAYTSIAQSPRRQITLIVRTGGSPMTVVPSIQEAVAQVDSQVALSQIRTMADLRRERSLTGTTEPAWVIGMFAIVAAFLAGLGLYGVLAHSVTQQRREIGIRMALGASGRTVVGQILRRALGVVSAGLLIGLAGTLTLTRVMTGLLFEVTALDPVVLASAALAMMCVGLAAAAIPASRAARVDPTTALRSE